MKRASVLDNDQMRTLLTEYVSRFDSRGQASRYFGMSKTALWAMESGSLKMTTRVAETLGYRKMSLFVKIPRRRG